MSPLEPMPLSEIDTSIVVATCSRAHLLRGALASLLASTEAWHLPTELVVVDDGSSDETPALLAEVQRTAGIPVTIVQGRRSGVASARNLGAAQARGKWLASFDDDQIALPGWLTSLRELADEKNASCVGGPLELLLPESQSLPVLGQRVRRVLGELSAGDKPRQGIQPASNNVLIRRDVFEQFDGYDLSFTEGAEDADLFSRILEAGHAIWFQPAARALHVTPAERLQQNNLRWTSLRLGAGDARRWNRKGNASLLGPCLLRTVVALLRDLPQLVFARVSRNQKLLRDVQCSLWYTEGLLRSVTAFVGASKGQSPFLRSLDFRSRNGERNETTLRA